MAQKRICPNCGKGEFKRRSTTYPLQLQERQMNVGRVSVNQCSGCGYLIPTAAGQEKLLRSLSAFASMLQAAGRPLDDLANVKLDGAMPPPVTQESAEAAATLRRLLRPPRLPRPPRRW
jgi:YgiT-type zinc finger domain-containing protein